MFSFINNRQCNLYFINLSSTSNRFLQLSPSMRMDYKFFLFYVFILIFANANQIKCPPKQPCLLNCTNTRASCSSLTINATQSSSLTVYCDDDSSCEYSTILCPPSLCHVECNAPYSCSDAVIHANRSSILHLYCAQHRSCFLSTVFGAQSVAHIDCSADRSCISSTFHLDATPNVTLHCHHTDATDNDNACSTNAFYVNNANDAHFQFEGNSVHKGGISNVIYGMYITHRLSIQCSGLQCSRDLDVYCPIAAQCIFTTDEHEMTPSSLDIIHFHIPNHDYPHLSMHCVSSPATMCSSADQRIIRCMDTDQTSIIAYDDINEKWHCFVHENHCCPDNLVQNSDDNVIYCHTAECIINCSDVSCAFMTVNATVSTSLIVYCDADYSCQGAHILCPNHQCHISCRDHYACQYMLVESVVSLESLRIECISAAYECQYITVHTHMTNDANIRILCGDEHSSRSCIRSTFNFHTLDNTHVDIACVGSFACYYASWYTMGISTVSLDCISRSSCELSIMDATLSSQLNVSCDARQACYSSDIRCPSHNVASCSIQCSDYGKSCSYLNIISTDSYVNQYLRLECPVNPASNYVCNEIQSHCGSGTYDADLYQKTLIAYEEMNGALHCLDSVCCPWIPTQSPTNTPTTEPTIEPTLNPSDITPDPTINPTMEPTMNPTYIPTLNPSDRRRPTIHPTNHVATSTAPTYPPTWIPSSKPVHGPHAYPTVDPFAKPSIKPILSNNPTMNPTSKVSVIWLTSTQNILHSDDTSVDVSSHGIIDKPETIYMLLVFILLFNISLLLCIVNYNLNKKKASVDDQQYAPVILYCVQVFDVFSDVILAAQLYEHHMYSSITYGTNHTRTNALYLLFVASVLFIVVPYIANFCSSIHIVLNISNNRLIHSFTKQYFRDNSVLYIVGVLFGGGSFGTLQLLNTNLMGIRQLSCGLSTLQLQQFVSHKLWCTTLLQNIPNFLIQLCFIVELRVVTQTVILSNASTLFNMLLHVCISAIVCITRTSKDQQEVPFTMRVSWIPRLNQNENEEQKIDFAHMEDPYQRFGNRMKLSLELNTLYDAMEFEVLSSERGRKRRNSANIYGVMKIDRVSHTKQKEIETFLNGKAELAEAMIIAFGYDVYFTDRYNFMVSAELNAAANAKRVHISKQMQMYLPQLWEGMKRESIPLSDAIFNQLNHEIERLKDEGNACDEVYTYSAGHESIRMEMEMKRNLSPHFVD